MYIRDNILESDNTKDRLMSKLPSYPNIDVNKIPLECPGCSYIADTRDNMFIHWIRANVIDEKGLVPHEDKRVGSKPKEASRNTAVDVKPNKLTYNSRTLHLPNIPISLRWLLLLGFGLYLVSPTINYILIKLIDNNPILGATVLVFSMMLMFRDIRKKIIVVAYLLPIALILSKWL